MNPFLFKLLIKANKLLRIANYTMTAVMILLAFLYVQYGLYPLHQTAIHLTWICIWASSVSTTLWIMQIELKNRNS